MTDFMTPSDIANRTSAAVTAAVEAGHDLGLAATDPRVLHDLFSVVVHLAPAPVVARIPTVLAPNADLDAVARRQQAELDVTHWLAEQRVPVIQPSPLVPREPVRRGRFSMTFWEFVEEERGKEPDYTRNSELVADLHGAMREYPGRLSFLSAAEPRFITESLALLENHPDLIDRDDLERARREWQILGPLVSSRDEFEQAFPEIDIQPIHGDSPVANVFPAVDGYRYADFELVTLGPIEWDLAALGPTLEAAYNRGAERNRTRPLNEDVMAFVNALGMLRTIASLALVPQLPVLGQYLKPTIDEWRATPFTAGPAD